VLGFVGKFLRGNLCKRGQPDRIADLLEEAAEYISHLEGRVEEMCDELIGILE
jgi:hypothetical protein